MAVVLALLALLVAGPRVVARFQLQVNSGLFWSSVRDGLYMQDVYGMGLVKPFVFGFIIATVACHVGMRTSGGTAGELIGDA